MNQSGGVVGREGEPEREESSKWGIYNSGLKRPLSLLPEHSDYGKASFIRSKV